MTLPPVPDKKESDTETMGKVLDLMSALRAALESSKSNQSAAPECSSEPVTQVMSSAGVVSVVRSVYRQQGGL